MTGTYTHTIEEMMKLTNHGTSSLRRYARENPTIAQRIGRRYFFDPDRTQDVIKQPKLTHAQLVVDWSKL